MRALVFLALFLLLIGPVSSSDSGQIGGEVEYSAEDGTLITSYWHTAEDARATIILLHMGGGSARGEYLNIAPMLQKRGFNTLAVDLREGGGRLGAPNQTADRLAGQDVQYCDAYPDIAASIGWLGENGINVPIILWGSSFSAALTVQYASKNPDNLLGAMAFSPASGGPMAACKPSLYVRDVLVPLITFRPDGEMGIESVQAQAELFRSLNIDYEVVEDGKHGSLMLDAAQTGKEMTLAWQKVDEFLARLIK